MATSGWFKVPNNIWVDMRYDNLTDTQVGAYVRLMSYVSNQETDGFVHEGRLRQIIRDGQFESTIEALKKAKLIEPGVVEDNPGYFLLDFMTLNSTKAEIDRFREQKSENMRKAVVRKTAAKLAEGQQVSEFYNDFVAIYNLYPGNRSNVSAQLKNWIKTCEETITTAEQVKELRIAVELYAQEMRSQAKSYGRSWKEQERWIKSPSNFILDKDGFENWKVVLIDAERKTGAPAEESVKANVPKLVEKPDTSLPWVHLVLSNMATQAEVDADFSAEKRKEEVEKRLAGKTPEYRSQYLEVNNLAYLFGGAN